MLSFLKNIFSDSPLESYQRLVEEITSQEVQLQGLSNEELTQKSASLKDGIAAAEDKEATLEQWVPLAFALAREAARRTLGQRHYDAQLVGGLALFNGKIAEMGTGEGKTLAATAPVYTRALMGKGVHVITVNDYLAQRDAVWMGQVYYLLGLTTACIVHDAAFMYDPSWKLQGVAAELADENRDELGSFKVQKDFLRPISRREAYRADIVYGTNHEFGFDYLRDNLAYHETDQVQREGSEGKTGHYFAVIDEVDSILIDEARTPLIISAPDTEAPDFYRLFAGLVSQLQKDTDYEVDEKAKFVQILDSGIEKIEKALAIDNLYDPQHVRLVHYLEESLKAKALFQRDRHYIVKDGEIVIVDEFTGRLMHGRRYSGGLHQAIEAKEGVKVQQEAKTYAQITIQNYFRLYEKVAGMTGTAQTSAEEFLKVYGLEVVVVPPHKPRVRIDHADLVYKTKDAKYEAIVKKVQECVERKQPVLVGTTSIDENELLSGYFSRAGVEHEVLNAKNHEREGEIIAQAGRPSHVTLATNMAGRGVDIILGGNPPTEIDALAVRNAGGLFVIGTQRNDARRIDNQLRGRAGRQGDPGETQFFLSLEDDMLRIFGGDRIKTLMSNLNIPEDMPLESGIVVRVLNEAQKKVEGFNFDARKHLLEYDDVLNRQRKAVYRRRQSLLEAKDEGHTQEALRDMVMKFLARAISRAQGSDSYTAEEQDFTTLTEALRSAKLLGAQEELTSEDVGRVEQGVIPQAIEERIAKVSADEHTGMRMLASMDIYWTNHLENLEALLEAVRMRAYGQKDPLVEYKRESYDLFKTLIADAEDWVVSHVFAESEMRSESRIMERAQEITFQSAPASSDKVGRNDLCPCGSGKKYKKCHGK